MTCDVFQDWTILIYKKSISPPPHLLSYGSTSTEPGRDPARYIPTNSVLLVAFHHRNGPQVEYCYPPIPSNTHNSSVIIPRDPSLAVVLPDEWSFLPFMCLPDGAHASEEEFICT